MIILGERRREKKKKKPDDTGPDEYGRRWRANNAMEERNSHVRR